MAEPDYYRILGIPPTATDKQIRFAYRKLVKKYHPDLFATAAEKARATAKFHEINRAYAVLGDPKRRGYYDQIRPQKPGPTGPTKTRETTAPPRPPTRAKPSLQDLAAFALGPFLRRLPRFRSRFAIGSTVKTAAAPLTKFFDQRARRISQRIFTRPPLQKATLLLGLLIPLGLFVALWKNPQAGTTWVLLENTVVEPLRPISPTFHEPNWTVVAYHAAASLCDAALKERVRLDEQDGGKAFFDRFDGSMAITVRVKNEAALAETYYQEELSRRTAAGTDLHALRKQAEDQASAFIKKNGLAQQVRKVQCSEVVLHNSDPWLVRIMKRVGFLS